MTAGPAQNRRSTAKVQVVQEQHAGPWKAGNEFLPYHPSASQVPPDYRDGWNHCYAAAQQAPVAAFDIGTWTKVANEVALVVSDPDSELSDGAKRALSWIIVVAGRAARVTPPARQDDFATLERAHLGDPVRRTGIYAKQRAGADRPWWIKPGETIEQAAEGWAQWCESRSLMGLPDLLRALAKRSAWQPQFDVMSPRQEALALQFVIEIAGRKGEAGSLPDPVRLLEMAQALYEAEREECGP